MIDLHSIEVKSYSESIGDSDVNSLFHAGLQYAPPARGTWNIVHIGFLMPESHEIFVGSDGCLRGVVLTAYEAKQEHRFSSVLIEEHNIIDGDLEEQLVKGCTDILSRLEKKPKAVQLFTTCIHKFTGCDLSFVFSRLEKLFPDIRFIDCYMTPITRQSGITPDEKMRIQVYGLIDKAEKECTDNGVTVLGNVHGMDENSDLRQMLSKNNRLYRDITLTKTWQDYQALGYSDYIIFTNPSSEKGAWALGKRLDKPVHFLPLCFRPQDIKEADQQLCEFLGTERMDTSELEKESTVLVKEIREIMTGWKAVIDYTATSRPFNLARYLVENGIDVSKVYLDAVASSDKEDFAWLKENRANTVLASPTNPAARFFHEDDHQSKNVLAIGQKAAYYEGTSNFVNMVEGGNYQGFSGLLSLLKDMKDAILKEKNVSSIIQIKGWGCNCAK